MTLTGKATDLGSGISYYQFSTNGNLTASSSGWISITNTTNEITQTYIVVNNGTYYFYAKDAAGNINKKAVVISNIRYVAQIGTIKYRTLREAIAAVKTDETILMIGDTTENNTVPEDKKFTLDLGEQTITGGIVNNGEMIIEGNGTMTTEAGNILENHGTLTINSGNYKVKKGGGTMIENHGVMTMNSGNIERENDGWGIDNQGSFYFNGGTINLKAEGSGVALINNSGITEMTDGIITSKSFGLVVQGGSFKSTGGSILVNNGDTAVCVRGNGSAYLYNTYVTAISSKGGKLVNQTEKYNNLIYIYTEDYDKYLSTVEGSNDGKVFQSEFMNNGHVFVTYYNTGYTTGSLAVWTVKDSQDDLEWIAPYYTQNQDLGFEFKKSNHKGESGIYRLHLYANSTSTFIEGIDINVP